MDEASNAIAGASVSFTWNKDDVTNPFRGGEHTLATQSDPAGLFSLRGERGRFLDIRISRDGYYTPRPGIWSFKYSAETRFSPNEPIIFVLKKRGRGEPLVLTKRNYGVPRDGTPVAIDLITGQTNRDNGDIVVTCWTQDSGKPPGATYDWRCVVTVPGGGLVVTNEELLFEAPESGYSPSTAIAMSADTQNWSSDVDLRFYYRLADGRYGRMTFSMIAGGHHFCMIDSVLNPTGSRNLEQAN